MALTYWNRCALRKTVHFTLGGAVWLLACRVWAGPEADKLPVLPEPQRVLTIRDVKNYWLNTLAAAPIPPRPLGLHPEEQRAWDRAVARRKDCIAAIKRGDYDTEARLAQFEHNIVAWRNSGDEKKARAEERKLLELREHIARMETMEEQKRAAAAQLEANQRLQRIEAEVSSLRSALPCPPCD
jgi:hypothetical protein